MQTEPDDMLHDMPTDFEVLEVRRAMLQGRAAEPEVDEAWLRFRRQMEREEVKAVSVSRPTVVWRYLLYVAAGMLLLLGLTVCLKSQHNGRTQVFTADSKQQSLTISADDGSKVTVADDVLDFNTPATPPRHIRMLEVSNPRGKVSRVVLPDGSTVWLNAESHLSFPECFTGKTRDVSLSGEAYFEVKHDTRHPFVVTTETMVTTVHGTVFDVRAYSSKDACVALVEGSVAVKTSHGDEHFIKPGQMAMLSAEGNFTFSNVDTYSLSQWTEGFFYFENSRLVDIMMELGRWYNVNIVFEDEASMNLRLHFVAEHKDSLAAIVKRINELSSARVSLADDVLTVK